MDIGVIGATGAIGRRVVTEALGRGHRVTGFSRTSRTSTRDEPDVVWKALDVFDVEALVAATGGLDVLISCYQPGNAAEDLAATVRDSIADPTVFARAAKAMLRAMESRLRLRLIVVGGAGSLELRPGLAEVDAPETLREGLRGIGLPETYEAAVRGHREALNVLRLSDRLWTYASPAHEIFPGERTGRFRVGGDQPVLDAEGRHRISTEDFAVALLDECELPRFVQRRFTVGY